MFTSKKRKILKRSITFTSISSRIPLLEDELVPSKIGDCIVDDILKCLLETPCLQAFTPKFEQTQYFES